jgi:hypothetical protein
MEAVLFCVAYRDQNHLVAVALSRKGERIDGLG